MKIFIILISFIINAYSEPIERVSLQLDWKIQFENAGFIMAKEKGFYKEAGLNLDILEYKNNIDIVSNVLSLSANYGIYQSNLSVQEGKLKPIVILATYLQKSPLILISHTNIKNPQELLNKKIMITDNELKYSSIGLFLNHYNITKDNSKIVDHSFNLDAFINKDIDIMSAFTSNQLYELNKKNIPYYIIEPSDYGFNMSAANLFTSKEEILNHPERTKKFIEASNKGFEYALKNIDETINILISKYSVKKSRDALVFEANELKKLMMLDFFKIGEINTELTKLTFRQLKKSGFIDKNEELGDFTFDDIVKNIDKTFYLTNEEKEYLQKKGVIKACVDPEWYPFEAIKHGEYIGIASDVMKHFSQKIGIPIEAQIVSSWQESIELAKNKKCDIFSLATSTPARREYMNFTSPYLNLPIVVATTNDKIFIDQFSDLKGKKIAAVSGYSIVEIIKSKYPFVDIVEVNSIKDGLDMVMSGRAYGYIDNLVSVSSYIQKNYSGLLKVSARLNQNLYFSVGTRKDEKILLDIFEKAIPTLKEDNLQTIYNKWISVIEEVSYFNKSLLTKIFLAAFFIVLVFLYREYILTKYNKKLKKLSNTDKLTGLCNRLFTDDKLEEEYKKIKQDTAYSCCVILIDIDFFKKTNDTYGHQIGDKVLINLSDILRANTRDSDIVSRWGGEEFLIILPDTTIENAIIACENLRQKVQNTNFETTKITISLGVGELNSQRSIVESISLIDKALYNSKLAGRNRVSIAS